VIALTDCALERDQLLIGIGTGAVRPGMRA
jgi:hypothetical protein